MEVDQDLCGESPEEGSGRALPPGEDDRATAASGGGTVNRSEGAEASTEASSDAHQPLPEQPAGIRNGIVLRPKKISLWFSWPAPGKGGTSPLETPAEEVTAEMLGNEIEKLHNVCITVRPPDIAFT